MTPSDPESPDSLFTDNELKAPDRIEARPEVDADSPLAWRMRPVVLDDFVGQVEAVGPGSLLRTLIEEDKLSSVIVWGPPGVGKTSLALVVSGSTKAHFEKVSAVTAGVAELRKVIEAAGARKSINGRRTVVLVDEIHRFNKAQQDALLPAVEDGRIILFGTTTENPYFEVNAALISRSRLIRLEPLTDLAIESLVRRALIDNEKGLGASGLEVDVDALAHIVRVAKGDARVALGVLEAAADMTLSVTDEAPVITLGIAEEAARAPALLYDKDGDVHYDVASAFIKSMRGSDADAALYWLAKMIVGGEDPRFIARRIVIFASEDVGLADPHALPIATAAASAVQMVGLPEARINLGHAVTYMALAPKSNSAYRAIDKAIADVKSERAGSVPVHLRDASYPGAKNLGHGKGYVYPHDSPGHWTPQGYMPPERAGAVYYVAGSEGVEPAMVEALEVRKRSANALSASAPTSQRARMPLSPEEQEQPEGGAV